MPDVGLSGGGDFMAKLEAELAEQAAAEVDPEAGKPLEQRLKSKTQITIVNALRDLGKEFASAPVNSADGWFSSQISLFKTYLSAAHPLKHEAAEDALGPFLEKVDPKLLKTKHAEIIQVLIDKGLTSNKASVKTKAEQNLILVFWSTEDFSAKILEPIKKQCDHKLPKMQAPAFTALSILLRAFGPEKINMKDFLSLMEVGVANKNANVREQALKCYEAGFVWGQAKLLKKHIEDSSDWNSAKNLKPGQKEIFVKRFDDYCKGVKVANIRKYLRSDPAPVASAEDAAGGDPSKQSFNQEWCYTVSEAKKWSEKKEAMEELIEACS